MTLPCWQPHPVIYQINTAVWLNTLSRRYHRPITLYNIPEEVFHELAGYHIDAVWLMGVWHRGEKCRASALNYLHEYRGALPDVTPDDVIGSAYAIGDYRVADNLGGREGMAVFRRQLGTLGIKLITDFVPNHVGKDHRWLQEHPEYFVLGTPELLKADTTNFFANTLADGSQNVVAHGRDPYFPGWIDTAQLNAFSPEYRQAAIETLRDIAQQCDGVRCDMAMLMLDDIFLQTWGWRGVEPLPQDFWSTVIGGVRAHYPDFLFIAETYWGLEYALQLEGFDYTYDKTCYDRLLEGNADSLYAHLSAHPDFLKRNIRFIENHDEPRAASAFGIERSRPAAVLIATTPGALLLHDGQFVGRRVKLPVQIQREPIEPEHDALKRFYLRLLEERQHDIYRYGEWTLFRRQSAGAGYHGHQNLIAYGWHLADEYRLIVINLSGMWSQARIDLSPWDGLLNDYNVRAYNVMTQSYAEHSPEEWFNNGLYVELDPYHVKVYKLHLEPKRMRQHASETF